MAGEANDMSSLPFRRDIDGGTRVQRDRRNTGSPLAGGGEPPNRRFARIRPAPPGMTDGFAVPRRPSNVGGGKGRAPVKPARSKQCKSAASKV